MYILSSIARRNMAEEYNMVIRKNKYRMQICACACAVILPLRVAGPE